MATTKKEAKGTKAAEDKSVKKAKATKTAKVSKTAKEKAPKHIGLVKNDPWLEPFEEAIKGRHSHAEWELAQLTRNGKKPRADFA